MLGFTQTSDSGATKGSRSLSVCTRSHVILPPGSMELSPWRWPSHCRIGCGCDPPGQVDRMGKSKRGTLSQRCVAALLLLAACQKPHPKPAFNYDIMLGVAIEKARRTCLDIRSQALFPGQPIRLVIPSMPPAVIEAEITRPNSTACASAHQNTPGLYYYEFRVVNGTLPNAVPAFALASYQGNLTVTDTGVIGDLDGDGQPETFRSCTSSEGVHLTVWKGKPLSGLRKWHSYYYLGYDVEPDCTEADTKPALP